MERLTKYHTNKSLGAYMVCSGTCTRDDFDCAACENMFNAINLLARYEDTDMTPEEIIEMASARRAVCKRYGVNQSSG